VVDVEPLELLDVVDGAAGVLALFESLELDEPLSLDVLLVDVLGEESPDDEDDEDDDELEPLRLSVL